LTTLLIVAPMRISQERRGPGIRSWELARALGRDHQVTLLVPNEDHPAPTGFAVRAWPRAETEDTAFDSLLAEHEIVVIQGPALQIYPRLSEILAAGQHYLVVDLYDPITLEQLAVDRGGQIGSWLQLEYRALLNEQLNLGDFFLCASERQRDYWLGALGALGRLSHDTWDGNEFRRLIDVVPFGLSARRPSTLPEPVLKAVVPGLTPSDQVIVWGGGLWDWLDPLTPIRAMEQVATRQPHARLVFFRSADGWTAMAERAWQLASELGLLDHQVLFAPWLSPEQWAACLSEADVGLSFHQASIETHFAFRTRLLDYIWAGLPIVTASGDVLGDLVTAQRLGHVVEPGDVGGLADALVSLLDEPDARGARRDRFRSVAATLTWDQATRPLAYYCAQPWHAGDARSGFPRRCLAAQRDRVLSEAAHAARRRAETEAHARALEEHLSAEQGKTGGLQHQLEELAQELRQSEDQLQAAMNGRVMRLMLSIQRRWRRLWGDPPR
jgi:glycosyltransferase involved in cell wall biosynthesis